MTSKQDSLFLPNQAEATPFVKWLGGKRQLLPRILPKINQSIKRYVEPFVGGGAVFWSINNADDFIINDSNTELINAYLVIKNSPKSLIGRLSDLEAVFYALKTDDEQKSMYLDIRKMDRDLDLFKKLSDVDRASRFLFLNKTCYNGLYRVNKKGFFNSDFSHPLKFSMRPNICNAENILACSHKLATTNIFNGDYRKLIPSAKEGDLWFIDPPYLPLLETAPSGETLKDFTSYTAQGFSIKDHLALANDLHSLNNVGAKFILTNHNSQLAQELYKDFNIEPVKASRLLNTKASLRKASKDNEIIVSNF